MEKRTLYNNNNIHIWVINFISVVLMGDDGFISYTLITIVMNIN